MFKCKINMLFLFFFLFIFVLYSTSCNKNTEASDFPDCFVGTYLNEEGSGAESIWNLHKDGTFSAVSSTQQELNFSGELGSWEQTGEREAKIVLLDFSFDSEGLPINIARADIGITFKGENCEETEGSFELRFFESGEDPLDINTDEGEAIQDTFTGRKLIL